MVVVNVSDSDDDNDEHFSKYSSGTGISAGSSTYATAPSTTTTSSTPVHPSFNTTTSTTPLSPPEHGTSVNMVERLERLGHHISSQLTEHFDVAVAIRIYHPYNQQHSSSHQKRVSHNDAFTSSSTAASSSPSRSPSKVTSSSLTGGIFEMHLDRPRKVDGRWVVELYTTDGTTPTNYMPKTSFKTHLYHTLTLIISLHIP